MRTDVPGLIKQFNAFIYSSEHDTFGIAVAEAMAANIPVFVNDIPVMKEITENGKLGTLYHAKNENDLLFQFKSFVQDKTPFVEKQNNALSIVNRKYSIREQISSLRRMYSKL